MGLVLGGLLALPVAAAPDEFTGEVNFLIGLKSLEENDWAPVEDQGMIGAEMSWGRTEWPVHIATDVIVSAAEEDTPIFDPFFGTVSTTITGTTFEVAAGIRKIWEAGRCRPYVGGGIALLVATIEGEALGITVDDDDSAIGPWVGGGVFWRLGAHFNLGASLRWSGADVDLFGVEADAGGLTYGLLLGFGWPGK